MLKKAFIITVGILSFIILKNQANEPGNEISSVMLQTGLPEENEMPLIVIAAEGNGKGPAFFFISGDGGWTSFDNSWCEQLTQKGLPVVGLDARKYFWKAKTPEETTSVLVPIIENYIKKWNSTGIVLAGYSFGADIVPFIANKLPDSLKSKVLLVLLLSPDRYGDFEIHLTDMLSLGIAKRRYNIVNEVKNITIPRVACIFGENEEAANIQAFRETGIKIYLLPGDHHYNKNVTGLTETILKSISE